MDTLGVIDYGQTHCSGCAVGACYLHGYTVVPWPWPTQVTFTAPPPAAKGWECPRCTRINAPTTPFCCKAGEK